MKDNRISPVIRLFAYETRKAYSAESFFIVRRTDLPESKPCGLKKKREAFGGRTDDGQERAALMAAKPSKQTAIHIHLERVVIFFFQAGQIKHSSATLE